MTSADIRSQFLNFFQEKQHTIVPSAPIVVKNDPTLMFTNAGMNQFKDYFLGNKKSPYNRAVDTQKCLRVSGKHNDLEEVGVDTYHHTMFEMLGNWSFGDYFKNEAIQWSWELLTHVFKIPKENIYVSVFEGDEKEGLAFDEESYNIWKTCLSNAGFTTSEIENRIIRGSKKDNFWEMGDMGPCGPCSEIHVDCRTPEEKAETPGCQLVNADHPQVIEIWNNVFMQFNRLKDGSLELLPAKHVDTGMGFERLVRVLQGKQSNYDTDVFSGTIQKIESIAGCKYDASDSKEAIAFRVLADHIRAISFTIADGQLPSNTGSGYVIRRILRRAVRYYYSYLNYKKPLLHQLVFVIASQFENVFPELKKQEDFVAKVIKEEEEAFLRTLEKGLKRIEDFITNDQKIISGKNAFELYDTYGFPIDLTRLIASENNKQIDETGFTAEMQQQKNRSRAATAVDTGDWKVLIEDAATSFVGYEDILVETKVVKYRAVEAKGKKSFQIVLAETPFYAESGGQVGDTGTLTFEHEKIHVINTKKENDLIIHWVEKLPEHIDAPVKAAIDVDKRLFTNYNHTATHLLHAALKQVLGTHVNQKGSLVSAETLRFDVSHFAKITEEEIHRIIQVVNEKIRQNTPVEIKEMPKEDAMKLGAMALFGEKYGNLVRVVTIDPTFSVELCGGTHVSATGMIGVFVITSETAVAAGVRRIEALTGGAAFRYLSERVNQYKQAAELLKSKDPLKAIEKLITDKAALEATIEKLEAKEIHNIKNELIATATEINGTYFVGEHIAVNNADALRKIALLFKNQWDKFVVVLTTQIDGKASVVVSVSESFIADKNIDANQIIKDKVAPIIKGGGGGQKTLATAGGQDVSNLAQVIAEAKTLL